MSINSAHFDKNGFVVLDNILSDETIADIELRLEQLPNGNAGTRNLLSADWCKHLSQRIAAQPLIKGLLPNPGVAVQCTYFRKSLKRNWLVPLHQDYVIPLKSRFSDPAWSMWSMKEGMHFARPPIAILESIVAVRVHLEANTRKNGLLQVIPGSHKSCSTSDARVDCFVSKGGALVVKPLIFHASSKIIDGQRRVLHFLYGPEQLPYPAEWAMILDYHCFQDIFEPPSNQV